MNLTTFPLAKILHILANGQNIAAAFLDAADQLVLTLTGDDQAALKEALATARARSDTLHQAVENRQKPKAAATLGGNNVNVPRAETARESDEVAKT